MSNQAPKRRQVGRASQPVAFPSSRRPRKAVLHSDPERDGSELPEGWAEAPLDGLVYLAGRIGWRGLTAAEYTPTGPMFLSVPNLNHGNEVDFTVVNHISQERYDESPEIKLRNNDSLLTKDGAGIGKLGFVKELPSPATVNSSLLVIRALESFEPKYLFYCLKAPEFQRLAQERITGSTTPHLFQKDIKTLRVRIAPLAEQRRIVGKLELLLGKVSSSQQRLSRVPGLLKRFCQSVLAAACSGKLTADWRAERLITEDEISTSLEPEEMEPPPFDVPSDWRWASLDTICSKITDGEHLTPPRVDSGVPILSAKDVRDNDVDFSEAKFVTADIAEKSRQRCNPDRSDILVVSRGATVGRTCRVKTDSVFCLMGSVLLFKPRSQIVLPEIIEYCFKTPTGLAALIARSGATAQQAIYIRDMRTFPVALPAAVRATRNRASRRKAVRVRGPDRGPAEAGSSARRPPHAVAAGQSLPRRTRPHRTRTRRARAP